MVLPRLRHLPRRESPLIPIRPAAISSGEEAVLPAEEEQVADRPPSDVAAASRAAASEAARSKAEVRSEAVAAVPAAVEPEESNDLKGIAYAVPF